MGRAHTRERSHLVKRILARKMWYMVGKAYVKEKLHLDLLAEYNKNTHTDHRQDFFLALNVCAEQSIKCGAKRKHSCNTTARLWKKHIMAIKKNNEQEIERKTITG